MGSWVPWNRTRSSGVVEFRSLAEVRVACPSEEMGTEPLVCLPDCHASGIRDASLLAVQIRVARRFL